MAFSRLTPEANVSQFPHPQTTRFFRIADKRKCSENHAFTNLSQLAKKQFPSTACSANSEISSFRKS
jgi:hypothetical protein